MQNNQIIGVFDKNDVFVFLSDHNGTFVPSKAAKIVVERSLDYEKAYEAVKAAMGDSSADLFSKSYNAIVAEQKPYLKKASEILDEKGEEAARKFLHAYFDQERIASNPHQVITSKPNKFEALSTWLFHPSNLLDTALLVGGTVSLVYGLSCFVSTSDISLFPPFSRKYIVVGAGAIVFGFLRKKWSK